MAEIFFPFDAGAGADSTEDRWRSMAALWLKSGVIFGELNGLSIFGDSSGPQVKVNTGKAWVNGHYYENDLIKILAVAANATGAVRRDRVVVELDTGANTVTAKVVTGTASLPPLVQTSSIWQIPLAQINVPNAFVSIVAGDVVDQRSFTSPGHWPLVCTSATRPATPFNGMHIYETDTKRLLAYDGAAWNQIGGAAPYCKVRHTANVPINSVTWTTVPFNTDMDDVDNLHDPATNNSRITAKLKGYYYVKAVLPISSNVSGDLRGARFLKNGGETYSRGTGLRGTDDDFTWVQVDDVVQMNVNDYIEVQAIQDSGATLNVAAFGDAPFMVAIWLAP